MSFIPSWTAELPCMHEELVRDRIQTLHREAEEQRLIHRMRQVRRARKQAERASVRLRQALARMA
ncbi:hypothetical protein [Sphaerisporangium fuscum]|uniref:hypothetical protein n=1 Tax=Sphaerisporangium fuscum TaxID=2835868 RepID=UPI001BDC19CB|nr:hypothetical protein [Sphaerisporangium fuscum]